MRPAGQGAVTRRSTLFLYSEIQIRGSNPDPCGQLRRSGGTRGKRPLSDGDSPMDLLREAADRSSRTTLGAPHDRPSDRDPRSPDRRSGEAASPAYPAGRRCRTRAGGEVRAVRRGGRWRRRSTSRRPRRVRRRGGSDTRGGASRGHRHGRRALCGGLRDALDHHRRDDRQQLGDHLCGGILLALLR